MTDLLELAVPLRRKDFIRQCLVDQVAEMLADLGDPPLIERIYPKGWRGISDEKLGDLYDLCIRTYRARAATGEQP